MQKGKRGGAFYVAFDKENFYLFVKIFLKNKKADQMIGFSIGVMTSMLRR